MRKNAYNKHSDLDAKVDDQHEITNPYEFSELLDNEPVVMTDRDADRAALRLRQLGAVPTGFMQDDKGPKSDSDGAEVVHVKFGRQD